ncbi:DUF4129 domain-containing protein [Ideonella sp. DXS29W]|uniref:DUF4129 domain-containing protein n=1 Tax=Ideonella lacteola TaxID=2984193 RepID=A0ABU9BPL3_9BURK
MTASAVTGAVDSLRAEGHFGQKHTERYLRFKRAEPPAQPQRPDDSWAWWRQFGDWLNRAGRVGIWTLCAVAAAVFVVMFLRARHRASSDARLDIETGAPQRVRQYDIRPESLPDDIGAAALALWQGGDARGALVLLYRGALSRLVHRHGLPIRGSSTEGDCLVLARRHLPAAPAEFFAQVTHARLLASYGGQRPEDHEVRALCQHFETRLAGPPGMTPEAGA